VTYPTDEDWEELTEAALARIDKMSVPELEQQCNNKDHYVLAEIINRTAGRMAQRFVNEGEW
jgi:hypothetical protein